MIEYQNIRKTGEIILSQDKKLSYEELKELIISETKNSVSKIIEFDINRQGQSIIKIQKDEIIYEVIALIKNITGAGWRDKPWIKRVQVSNIATREISLNDRKFNLIFGVYSFDDNPLFVCWDPYRYLNHVTQRSCYVSITTLQRGYEKEYYEGVDSSQKVWVFKGNNFDKFISNYIKYLSENMGVGK